MKLCHIMVASPTPHEASFTAKHSSACACTLLNMTRIIFEDCYEGRACTASGVVHASVLAACCNA